LKPFEAVGSRGTARSQKQIATISAPLPTNFPAEVRDKFRSVLAWADNIEEWNDVIIDGSCKESDRRIQEIMFLEEQIKILIQAIRVTKDVDSIRALRATTRETIERMEVRKREEDFKRLQEESAVFTPPPGVSSVVVP
jgi:hypothetical protein